MFLDLTLVGGTRKREGNIMIGGLPVCDDHHGEKNALVVCRCHASLFYNTIVNRPSVKLSCHQYIIDRVSN